MINQLTELARNIAIAGGVPRSANSISVPTGILLLVVCFLATACGGSDSSAPPAPKFTVDGSVSGLLPGLSVVLQNNSANNTTVAVNSAFSFSTALASSSTYSVTVLTQPTGQSCTVTNGTGTISAANVSVAVACTTKSYTVGGMVTGLGQGLSLSLQDNQGATAAVTANGAFTLSPAHLSGSTYIVTVLTPQPIGQVCTVSNGSGTITGANVTTVTVACTTNTYAISANVFGLLAKSSLTLQDNGTDNLAVTAGGVANFKTQVASGSPYAVTIATQPTGQTCFVTNGSGTVTGAAVTVSVVCPWEVAYVPNYYDNSISAYYIDPTSGSLLPLAASPFATQAFYTYGIAVSPNKKFVYATSSVATGGVVVGFVIDPATGVLTPIPEGPFATGYVPQSITIDPTGRFVYVGCIGYSGFDQSYPDGLYAYAIDAMTGALTPISGSPVMNPPNPVALTVDTSGQYLLTSGAIYSINSVTGALTATTSTVNFLNAAVAGGKFIYAADSQTSTGLVAYSFDTTSGNLTQIAQSSYGGYELSITPNSEYIYALGNGQLSGFNIDPTSGLPSLFAGSPFTLPAGADAMAVDPSGHFIYTSDVTQGNIQAFSINTTTGVFTMVLGSPYYGAGFSLKGGYSIAFYALPL